MMARLLAGLILLLIWLLGTQSGLRALVAVAVDWAPVGLSVEQVEGRVLGRMGLDGLVIDHPSLRIELGRLVLDWSPTRLSSGRLYIHELGLDRLDLTLPEQPERDDRGLTLPELRLPVTIELERALIRSLRVLQDPAGPPTWQAEQILLGGRLIGDRLELEQIGMVLAEPRIELAGSGSLGLVEPHGLDLVLDAVLGRAPHRDLLGHARVQADLARLEARVRVSGLAEADLQLQVARPLDQPRWDARLMLGALDLGVIADRLPAIALSGLVTSRGEWGAADLGARLVLDSPSVEPIETGLDLFWEGDRLRVRALDVTQASSGTRLSTSGQVEVRSDRGSLTADVPSPDDWARARARLDRLSLERPELGGVWDLERPAQLDWDWPELSAEPFCLRHAGGSRACLRLSHLTSADWEAGVDLDPLVLGLLAPSLPDALALEGRARVNGRVMTTGGALGAEATARIETGTLVIAAVAEKVLSLAGAQLEIAALPEGRAGRDRARAQLALPLGDLGRLDAELELPGWRLSDGLRPEQALAGRVRADLQRLDWVTDQIARPLTRVRGRAEAGVRLAGTLADPRLSGEAVLQAERISVPLIGLEVNDLRLSAVVPSETRLQLTGSALIGDGELRISGDGERSGERARALIQARGDGLDVAATPEYELTISPRLTLELTETGGALRGAILIPEARIQPRTRPEGVVMPSRDVVIKGTDRPPAYPLDLAITLEAGDAVRVDAFGLSGRIVGSLDLTQAAGRTLTGDGRLSIIDGEYRVPIGPRRLAQLLPPLTISRGELIWAQTPLLNPGLLVQAQRSTGQTTANVRILGTLADPRLAFFSDRDPDMSESDAIFFLITGMTPSGRQPEQIAVLDLGAWITAGTFLKLQTGLGTGLSQLRLRRDLSERLQIQVQGGATPSADVFWTYER